MNMNSDNQARPLPPVSVAHVVRSAVSMATRVPAPALACASRGPAAAAHARQTAMYLAHVGFGLSLTQVGSCFGRDRTTVRHACALIEDGRDDPARDLSLCALEAGLVAAGASVLAGCEGEI